MASSIQLLRSATTQERPIASNLLDGQPAVNTSAAEPGLFFKASDGSLVKVGPTAITTDGAPPNASATGSTGNSIGEMWLDKSLDPPVLKVYDGTAWVNAGSGNVTLLRWTKTAVGGETSLSGPDDASQPLNYTPGLEQLYLNGVLLERGTDYVGTSGTAFTSLSPLTAGDVVMVLAYSPFNIVDIPDDSIDGSKLIDGSVSLSKLSGSGSFPSSAITYSPSGTGATDRTVESRLRDSYNIRDFGVNGDGSDETLKMQAAIDAVHAAGGGSLLIPFTSQKYRITSPLILRPNVSLIGTGGSPLIENTRTSGGVGLQEVLLPGNFHPDFTEELTYYPCGNVQAGNVVTLQNLGDASNFAVGDQIVVSSTATTLAAGFTIPVYMILSTIKDINGSVITLNEPIDTAFPGRIAKPSSTPGRRGIPLFFSYNSVVSDLTLKANFYPWINDSACLNVTFQRLNVYSSTAIYGNAYQTTRWIDCNFYYSRGIGEQSHNSLNTIADRCNFLYWDDGGNPQSTGVSIQECARKIRYVNSTIVTSSTFTGVTLITIIDAQDVKFSNLHCKVPSSLYGSASLIQLNASGVPNFPGIGRIIEDSVFEVNTCGRYLRCESVSNPLQVGNGLRNCEFRGVNTQPDSIYLSNCIGFFVKDCKFPTGSFFVVGSSSKNVIENNYIHNGFIATSGSSNSLYQQNHIRNNRSFKSEVKQAITANSFSSQTIGPSASVDVISTSLLDSLIPRDKIDLDLLLSMQGSTGTSVVTFLFTDNTTLTDHIVAQYTLSSSSPGLYSFKASVYFTDSESLVERSLTDPSGVTTSSSQALSTIDRSHYLTMKLNVNSSGGDASCAVKKINTGISNPFYS